MAPSHLARARGGPRTFRPTTQAKAGQTGGRPDADSRTPIHYPVIDRLFTGNKKFAGSGEGPALNGRDTDPSSLELIGTWKSNEPRELEMDPVWSKLSCGFTVVEF